MIRIALVGFGTVGQGFAGILRDKAASLTAVYGLDARIVAVVTRARGSLYHPDGLDIPSLLSAIAAGSLAHYPETSGLIRDWDAARTAGETNADILIEASPTDLTTGQPALDVCQIAFASDKHVVLANKGPVAVAYDDLKRWAAESGRLLRFEGTVMAGTPSIRLAMNALAGCTIHEVKGILNGTTNYMLTQMEDGMTYADALAQAQALGYAEADPTADVDGWDAAGKGIILAAALFGVRLHLEAMSVHGIRHLTPADIETARAAGERWKLIVRITPDGGSVAPVRLPNTHPLAGVSGGINAITYSTDLLGDVTLIGAGAGRIQTGFALLADVLDIHRLVFMPPL